MLNCVHKLVAYCVCLLFGAEQVLVVCGFTEPHGKEQLLVVAENYVLGAVRANQNTKAVCWTAYERAETLLRAKSFYLRV